MGNIISVAVFKALGKRQKINSKRGHKIVQITSKKNVYFKYLNKCPQYLIKTGAKVKPQYKIAIDKEHFEIEK